MGKKKMFSFLEREGSTIQLQMSPLITLQGLICMTIIYMGMA